MATKPLAELASERKPLARSSATQAISEFLGAAAANWRQLNGKPPMVPDETILLWHARFALVPADVLCGAFNKALDTLKFFPTIADIVGFIGATDSAAAEFEAEEAWRTAQDYADEWCYRDYPVASQPPLPSDPAIANGVRAAGGYKAIALASHEELVWKRKVFLEIFNKTRNAPDLAQLAALNGIAERKTLTSGLRVLEMPAPAEERQQISDPASWERERAVEHAKDDRSPMPMSTAEIEARKKKLKDDFAAHLARSEKPVVAVG